MVDSPAGTDYRVLILAPTGRDGKLVATMLRDRNFDADSINTMPEFCDRIAAGVGAAIVTEEALADETLGLLTSTLAAQPAWSDIPLIILTAGGKDEAVRTWEFLRRLDPVGNVALLERPLRSMTLAKAVEVALRSRRRQYEVKSLNDTLEMRVAERTAELQRLNREAEGFSYSISHDLRTPLRAIVSTSQMLLHDFRAVLPPEAVHHLHRQSEAATRLATLIDELLKLSRLSHREMKPVTFDISELAHAVADELHPAGEDDRYAITIEDGLTAFGDAFLIRFVLFNLFHNARKFMPEGGCIAFGRRGLDTFFVRDEGIGFDMRYADKLFLPFERLVTDAQFSGTGIGLANVKRIVERHHGQVWAESAPGAGSTFFFTLGYPMPKNPLEGL